MIPLMCGLAVGGIATLRRSMSASVVPVRFWNPGISPSGIPVCRIASRSARSASRAARLGNTPGYSTGSRVASSGRTTYLLNWASSLGRVRFHESFSGSGMITSLTSGLPSRDTWVYGPDWVVPASSA